MRSLSVLLLAIAILVHNSYSLDFTIMLTAQQRFCFYEVFEIHQKYTFVTRSTLSMKQEVEVSHIDDRNWKSIFFRATQGSDNIVRVDKLAGVATTYSFCVKNMESSDYPIHIEFAHGLEVLEFHTLPDANDADNLDRELNWLDGQTNTLATKSENIEGLRRINEQINAMVGTKMIIFAAIGLLAIGGVNLMFYKVIKHELKKRKLI